MRVKIDLNGSFKVVAILILLAWGTFKQDTPAMKDFQALMKQRRAGEMYQDARNSTALNQPLPLPSVLTGQQPGFSRINETVATAPPPAATTTTNDDDHQKVSSQDASTSSLPLQSPTLAPTTDPQPKPTLSATDEEAIKVSRRQSYEKYGVPMEQPLLPNTVPMKEFSHIHYLAHSGLGHRLVRQAAGVYVGRKIGFALRGYWSPNQYANRSKDLFSELFDPYTRADFPFVNSTNRTIKFGNEVDGMMSPAQRCGGSRSIGYCKQTNTQGQEGPDCGCTFDEIQIHHDFFQGLRDRYNRRQQLESFMAKWNYSDHTVFGIHIRAGNGEQKDFTFKERGIHHDPEVFVERFIKVIRETIPMDTLEKAPMIFLATDDPKYRTRMTNELQKQGLSWPVVVLEQEFAEEGVILSGVNRFFEKWHSMLQDMLLLSYSDVLIAAKYSSFTQAIPKYLVLERPESERKLHDNYCELVDGNEHGKKEGVGPELSLFCYHSYMQNCCGTDNVVQRKVTKFLRPDLRDQELDLKIQEFQRGQYFSFEDSRGRGSS